MEKGWLDVFCIRTSTCVTDAVYDPIFSSDIEVPFVAPIQFVILARRPVVDEVHQCLQMAICGWDHLFLATEADVCQEGNPYCP